MYMCCCAFRSLVGALLEGGASALWVVAHLVLVTCTLPAASDLGFKSQRKSRIFGCLVGGGQGKEKRADMVLEGA
jgi:hypothetical protein